MGVSSVGFATPITAAVNPSTHAVLVEASITPSGTQDVNLVKIAGTSAVTAGVAGTLAVGGNQATTGLISANVYPTLIAGSDYQSPAHIESLFVDGSGRISVMLNDGNGTKITSTSQALNVSVQGVGVTATDLGKAVDNAAGATDTGVAPLLVRDDALTTLTPVDGDYVQGRTDQWGDTWVSLGTKLDSTNDSVTADTELPAAATIAADAVTPTVPGIASYNFIKTPGANTWDRSYSAVNATNSTGTGITAVGVIGQFDDSSPTSITENQFGNIRMSANRNLYGTIRDAAGNERGANVNSTNELNTAVRGGTDTGARADGISNTVNAWQGIGGSLLYVLTQGFLFNNSTWDRTRSVINATDSIGTGITAVGLIAQLDNTSPTVPTENQFANVRMHKNRSLLASPWSGTGTITSVNDNASNVTLLAANLDRLGATITNTSTVSLYAKCAATATVTSFTAIILAQGYWEVPFGYTGIIDGIWASDPNTGAAVVTEFT